jgi:hypothetical protein
MRITTRARVAFALAVGALVLVALAGPQLAAAGSGAEGGGGEPGRDGGSAPADPGGGVSGICVEDSGEAVFECDDMIGAPKTGCGEQVLGTGPDAAVSFTPCPGDDPGGRVDPDGGARLVVPRPGMADVRPHPFDHAVVSDDGRSVTVFFWSGVEPCYVLDHVDVAYGPNAVTITLFEGHDAIAGDVACIEIALLKKVLVQLDEPVGARRIVDGAA